jgi:hypothetical protein
VVRKYLFADESGNFDFRSHTQFPNGPSRYFSVGTIVVEGDDALRQLDADLLKLKRDLAWKNVVHDSGLASSSSQASPESGRHASAPDPLRHDPAP